MNHMFKQAVVLTVIALAGTPAVAQPQNMTGEEGHQSTTRPVTDQDSACKKDELSPACRPPVVPPYVSTYDGRQRTTPINSMSANAWTAPKRLTNGLLTPEEAGEMGDVYGSRLIPPDIQKIMSDPRIDPVTAYMLRQAARKPIGDWTMQQASEITQTIPTLIESGINLAKLQALYKFLGLDPNNLFEPQLSPNWQQTSTTYSAPNYAASSSTDCQADPSMMTVSEFMMCSSDNNPDENPN